MLLIPAGMYYWNSLVLETLICPQHENEITANHKTVMIKNANHRYYILVSKVPAVIAESKAALNII